MLVQNISSEIQYVVNTPEPWSRVAVVGARDEDLFSDDVVTQVTDAKLKARETGNPVHVDVPAAPGSGDLKWRLTIECLGGAGDEAHLVTTVQDHSEITRRDALNTALLREVSHRSKNLLAMVLGLCTQTARFATDIDDFLYRFRGRVLSMSRTQDIVTDSKWRGARFRALAHSQTDPFLTGFAETCSVEGEDPYLSPIGALHVGLALHELSVNSAARGSLGRRPGQIRMTARYDEVDAQSTDVDSGNLTIEWHECLDPDTSGALWGDEVDAPDFARPLLTNVVPTSLGGSASFRGDDRELRYTLNVPPDQYEP